MSHTASDGKVFQHAGQYRKYQDWLDVEAKAPTGRAHEQGVKDHGLPKRVIIDNEGNGRHRVTMIHVDGEKTTSVHPEAYRAMDVARETYVPPPPEAIQTHARSRVHPVGEKEIARIRKEDGEQEEAQDSL